MKLRASHYEVLSRLAGQHAGKLRRLPGGFWVDDPELSEYQQGDWSTSRPIVIAMQAAQLLEKVSEFEFQMTALGEVALRTGVYPC